MALFLGVYLPIIGEKYLFLLLLMLFCILLTINILSWVKIIKDNQKEIKPYLFYFILYLFLFIYFFHFIFNCFV